MAKKKIETTLITDDFTGEEISGGAVEVSLSYKGKTYNLDLSEKSATALDDAITPFIANAEPEPAKGTTAPIRSASDLDAAAVREWARINNIPANPRGRLSKSLTNAYRMAPENR
ncbi:histone-like nucleoid-structuring protein Lsr2 [Microcella humidisoli]|uniref:Lsr2 family protein n=1 Tax=Microcella humidisoli TaxID=2963406 RepID=A0ABY5FX93_9MICO|nr:Lsr2 family protein [Microcella humidisoli]UTT62539.1 Lsr2 family protein [Microcella humidisoli]UTT62552.1 Lsr2 family protein [Microcella humidisoli]